MADTITAALFVRLEAKPGKEAQREPAIKPCFAVRFGPSTFGIFDTFPNDAGRGAHLAGRVWKALAEKPRALLTAAEYRET
jgi:hypothetical protein